METLPSRNSERRGAWVGRHVLLALTLVMMGFQCGMEDVRVANAWHTHSAEDEGRLVAKPSREPNEVCAGALCVSVDEALVVNKDHYNVVVSVSNGRDHAVSVAMDGVSFAVPERETGHSENSWHPLDCHVIREGKPREIYRRYGKPYGDGRWTWVNPGDGSDTRKVEAEELVFQVPAGEKAGFDMGFPGTPPQAVLSVRITDQETKRDEWFHFWLQYE